MSRIESPELLSRIAKTEGVPAARCPQRHYQELRAHGSVLTIEGRTTLLGRGQVEQALRSPLVFSSGLAAINLGSQRPLIPLHINPPDHARYRRLLDPLFAPRRITGLEDRVHRRVTDLIDHVLPRGECDFVTDFALRLPAGVFLDLLGVPSDALDLVLTIQRNILRPSADDSERRMRAAEGGRQSYELFSRLLDERQRNPRNDILSGLLCAELDGERLKREELLDICYLLLLGGIDTTSDALECMFASLATHAELRTSIVRDPGLIPLAVDELLRWESPTTTVRRHLAQDVELGGVHLAAGQQVDVVLASANTDDAHLPDALTVNLRRSPNHHLAFGLGIHRCLGAQLARLELVTAVREWHRRIPEYNVAPGTALRYGLGGYLRYVEALPLVW
jgi:cytochrome P450